MQVPSNGDLDAKPEFALSKLHIGASQKHGIHKLTEKEKQTSDDHIVAASVTKWSENVVIHVSYIISGVYRLVVCRTPETTAASVSVGSVNAGNVVGWNGKRDHTGIGDGSESCTMEKISFGKASEVKDVCKIFSSRQGKIVIMTTSGNDNWSLQHHSTEAVCVHRLRGCALECAAWLEDMESQNSVQNTSAGCLESSEENDVPFVVGTRNGSIFTVSLNCDDREKWTSTSVKHFAELPNNSPVLALHFRKIHRHDSDSPVVYSIIACSNRCLYHLYGGPASDLGIRQIVNGVSVASHHLRHISQTMSGEHYYLHHSPPVSSKTSVGANPVIIAPESKDSSQCLVEDTSKYCLLEVPRSLTRAELIVESRKENLRIFWFCGIGVVSMNILSKTVVKKTIIQFSHPIVYYYDILFDTVSFDLNAIQHLFPPPPSPPPLSFAMTEYHMFFIVKGSIVVVSKVSSSKVDEIPIDIVEGEVVKGFINSEYAFNNDILLLTNNRILKLDRINENSNLWKSYLNLHDFEKASQQCINDEQREHVIIEHGNFLFRNRKFKSAAKVYSSSTALKFESVALFFLSTRNDAALVQYVREWLRKCTVDKSVSVSRLPQANASMIQQLMLFVWVVELYSSLMNQIQYSLLNLSATLSNKMAYIETEKNEKSAESLKSLILKEEVTEQLEEKKKKLERQLEYYSSELRTVLSEYCNIEEAQQTVYSILTSLRKTEELLYYAQLLEDYEVIVEYHVNQQLYSKLMDKLKTFGNISSRNFYLYKYASLLFYYEPSKFVDLCTSPLMGDVDISRIVLAILASVNLPYITPTDDNFTKPTCNDHRKAVIKLLEFNLIIKDQGESFLEILQSTIVALMSIRMDERDSEKVLSHQSDSEVHRVDASIPLSVYNMYPSICQRWNRHNCKHSILLALYAAGDTEQDEALLLQRVMLSLRNDILSVKFKDARKEIDMNFDITFILNLCKLRKKLKVTILLQAYLKFYKVAINKALKLKAFDMAHFIALLPDNEFKRTKLWDAIAYHSAMSFDVDQILKLVRDSYGQVKINRILSFLCASDIIDAFKSDICEALEDFDKKTAAKMQDIESQISAIHSVRDDIRELSRRKVSISRDRVCDFCCQQLFLDQGISDPDHLPSSAKHGETPTRVALQTTGTTERGSKTDDISRFYVFSCGHCLHSICAHRLTYPTMSATNSKRYQLLIGKISMYFDEIDAYERRRRDTSRSDVTLFSNMRTETGECADSSRNASDESTAVNQITRIRNDLELQQANSTVTCLTREADAILAEECPFCGNRMAWSVGFPFVDVRDPEEYDLIEDWCLE